MKPVDLASLRETVSAYEWYFTDTQKKYWDDLLKRFEDEDCNECQTCLEIRRGMSKNASSNQDDNETARRKGAERHRLSTQMFKHLDEDNSRHSAFGGHVFPPPSRRLYLPAQAEDSGSSQELQRAAGSSDPNNIPADIEEEGDRELVRQSRQVRLEALRVAAAVRRSSAFNGGF